jgi:basic membrane protein A
MTDFSTNARIAHYSPHGKHRMSFYRHIILLPRRSFNNTVTVLVILALSQLTIASSHTMAREVTAPKDSPLFKPAVVYVSIEQDVDNSFITSAISGANRAREELGIETAIFAIKPNNDSYTALKDIAQKGYSPIIAVGNQNVLPVQNLANQFPKTRFSVIDGLVPPLYLNVQSVTFKDHEGAFLMGYIAASTSKKNHIGFIGGMDVPLIRNFAYGYEQGAKLAKKEIRIDQDMVGETSEAWNNPEKAFTLAQKQFDNGADVIFGAAGGSTRGVLKAAQTYNKLGIGVDTNQNGLYPGHVLTSLVKRVDIAVYDTLKNGKKGQWQPGIKLLGLKEGALDFAVDQHNKELMNTTLVDKTANVKERIINGIIDVKSYTAR